MAVEYPNRRQPKMGEKIVTGLIVGRDKKVIPQNEVEHLASLGCTDRDIAEYYDISESTLRYNFSSDLVKGRHQLKTSLRQKQLQVAFEGNATMLIFLGKNYLGMSDSPQMSENTRALPWSDEFDENVISDDLEDEVEDQNADRTEI